jgi:hypothetical protein
VGKLWAAEVPSLIDRQVHARDDGAPETVVVNRRLGTDCLHFGYYALGYFRRQLHLEHGVIYQHALEGVDGKGMVILDEE